MAVTHILFSTPVKKQLVDKFVKAEVSVTKVKSIVIDGLALHNQRVKMNNVLSCQVEENIYEVFVKS